MCVLTRVISTYMYVREARKMALLTDTCTCTLLHMQRHQLFHAEKWQGGGIIWRWTSTSTETGIISAQSSTEIVVHVCAYTCNMLKKLEKWPCWPIMSRYMYLVTHAIPPWSTHSSMQGVYKGGASSGGGHPPPPRPASSQPSQVRKWLFMCIHMSNCIWW